MTDHTEQYLKIYHNDLSENEKLVLQIFAYCFASLTVHGLINLLGRRIPTEELTELYETLRRKELIIVREYDLKIRKDIALTVLADAMNNEKFGQLIPEIQKYETPYYWTKEPYRHLRDLVVAHFGNDEETIADAIENVHEHITRYYDYLEPVAGQPRYDRLFRTLGEKKLYAMLNDALLEIHADLRPVERIIRFDQKLRNIPNVVIDGRSSLLFRAVCHLLDGRLAQMKACVEQLPEKYRNTLLPEGVYALYKGDAVQAYQIMHQSMASKNNKEMFVNYGIFYSSYYILALLGMAPECYTADAQKMLESKEAGYSYPVIIASAMMFYRLNKQKNTDEAMQRAEHFASSVGAMETVFMYIAACFTQTNLHYRHLPTGKNLLEKTIKCGYKLLALELAFALSEIYRGKELEDTYAALSDELQMDAVLSRKPDADDRSPLSSRLQGAAATGISGGKPTSDRPVRVIYYIDPTNRKVIPVQQTTTLSGRWSKGRTVPLKRMKEFDVEGMSEHDQQIAATIKTIYHNNWGDSEICFSDSVWPALAGHPYLFMNGNPNIPVELIKTQPTIIVEDTGTEFVLKTDATPDNNAFVILKETGARYKLIEIDDQQRALLQTFDRGEMIIPSEDKDRLIQMIDRLSGLFTIQTDLTEIRQDMPVVEGNPRIRVQLMPMGNSLKIELFVKPFNDAPPYCKPGAGGRTIIGTINGERCCLHRDLKTETDCAAIILREIRENINVDVSQQPIVLNDPRDSLFLLDLLSHHQDIAVVEWPEGARFKIRNTAGMSNMHIDVKGVDYWFAVDGSLQIDAQTVLSLRQLLDMNTRSHGRFVELHEGEFIALSDELKQRIDELKTYTEMSGGQIKMNRFASIPIAETFDRIGSFSNDSEWMAFRQKLTDAKEIYPVVPETLTAELRPYQEEGFRWMVRLSEWGAGACLADDMGLGKTVQALTLLLHRADKGAALVVCPASVLPNWVSEVNRFAPSLNVKLLTTLNRRETIEESTASDLVITTYGLLQSEEKLFAKAKWATVVLDEAHVIKNNHTKKSRSAMTLNADYRLAMTGTPVQNHLGELWNLFQFINPGLLGILSKFNNRYAKDIENGSKQLKKLVAPYILRRTKNSVLKELPPKTEIVIQVELSDKEINLYEAIRQQAIENMADAPVSAGQQHMKALAEITRLRLACCNPALVAPNINIASSKLAAFMDIVEELLGNNHRALVFSQFVKHLDLVRRALDEKMIHYQYLDGSTPIAKREQSVRDFQAGDGELFLISLKAGGLGLNLTAADYVIHLDPWWNPAIEDQASDRAHRIGQTRPVTIYRLVARNTIEEKIIDLHRTKRHIAESILEGSDAPGKLSTEELLRLIMEK